MVKHLDRTNSNITFNVIHFYYFIQSSCSFIGLLASVSHTLQPLWDLSASKIHNDRRGVATRFYSWSATGCRLIRVWSATSWRPLCDLMQLVGDRSPTNRRLSQLKIAIKKKDIDSIFLYCFFICRMRNLVNLLLLFMLFLSARALFIRAGKYCH